MSLLLALLLAGAPDAGPVFRDSAVGRALAGESVAALDERWVELGGKPLLLRVERKVDTTALALYALQAPASADAGPRFKEQARFPVPGSSRVLDKVEELSLGGAGRAVAVTTREDNPDDEPVTLTLVGPGPALLFQGSYLHDVSEGGRLVSLAGTAEGFSFRDLDGDGTPELLLASEPKRLTVTGPAGQARVEVGRQLREYQLRGGRYQLTAERYQDDLRPLPLQDRAHPALVDGKLTTSALLKPGQEEVLTLAPGTVVRLVRVIPCPEGRPEQALKAFSLRLGEGAPLQVEGARVTDPRALGAGEFDLGPGGGRQVLVFFDPPLPVATLGLTVEQAGKAGACLAELSAH